MECWSVVIQWETVLHFPCAAGMGSVVEVGTACRHGNVFVYRRCMCTRQEWEEGPLIHYFIWNWFSKSLLPEGPAILLNSRWMGTPTFLFLNQHVRCPTHPKILFLFLGFSLYLLNLYNMKTLKDWYWSVTLHENLGISKCFSFLFFWIWEKSRGHMWPE